MKHQQESSQGYCASNQWGKTNLTCREKEGFQFTKCQETPISKIITHYLYITQNSKRNVRLIFFWFILLKDIFDYYIIIIPLFGFQCGYGMTERSDFTLNEINGYYNSNDRWKFILFFN